MQGFQWPTDSLGAEGPDSSLIHAATQQHWTSHREAVTNKEATTPWSRSFLWSREGCSYSCRFQSHAAATVTSAIATQTQLLDQDEAATLSPASRLQVTGTPLRWLRPPDRSSQSGRALWRSMFRKEECTLKKRKGIGLRSRACHTETCISVCSGCYNKTT